MKLKPITWQNKEKTISTRMITGTYTIEAVTQKYGPLLNRAEKIIGYRAYKSINGVFNGRVPLSLLTDDGVVCDVFDTIEEARDLCNLNYHNTIMDLFEA